MTEKNEPKGSDKILKYKTETAMVQFGLDKNYDVREELVNIPRIAEVPFDSTRKLMTTIHQLEDGKYLVATKGAPEGCSGLDADTT